MLPSDSDHVTSTEETATRMPLVIDNERDFIERNIMLLQELLGLPVGSTTTLEQAKDSTTNSHDDMATFPATENVRMGRGPSFEDDGKYEQSTDNANEIDDHFGVQTTLESRPETTVRDQVTETTRLETPASTTTEMSTSPQTTSTQSSTSKKTTLSTTVKSTTEERIIETTTKQLQTTSTERITPTTEERIIETTTRKKVSTSAQPIITTKTVNTSTTEKSTPVTSTKRSKPPTKKNSDAEDIAFLKQLVSQRNSLKKTLINCHPFPATIALSGGQSKAS